jgi:DivIVA domain-containing protein
MIDLTPLDVRKKKGDFKRAVRGYDPELVDDFLDMVAERLEELVKQNVALTERAEHLQEQVASYRDREKALNEALVTAQQLRAESQVQADREAELVRREAQGQAERIVEEGQRSMRAITRQIETLDARKRQFVRAFKVLLEGYLSDLELEDGRAGEGLAELAEESAEEPEPEPATPDPPSEGEEGKEANGSGWLSSLVSDSDEPEKEDSV